MESIADVLKRLPRKDSMIAQAEQTIREVLQHPMIRRLQEKHPELDEQAIKLNMNRLYQYVTEYDRCSHCPGLDRCPNDFTGHYTKLTLEGTEAGVHIHDQKVPCKKMIAQQTEEAIRRRIRSFYVDERALKQGFSYAEILRKDLDRAASVGQITDYMIQTRQDGIQTRGLYLHGKFGTGKTYLMCYMLHELAKIGLSGVIVYMPDFVEDLKLMFHEPQKMKETMDVLKETDLLVFDDIGAENLNPWVRDHVLGTILNYRMNRRPTFFTSNYNLDELEKHLSFTSKDGDEEFKGQRIMERIRSYVDVVVVGGRNHRRDEQE